MAFRRRSIVLALTCLSLTFSWAAGCGKAGPKVVSVKGKLTSNGKPVAGARIRFLPEGDQGRSAFADVDDSGSFRATTFKPGDGLVPGQYKVDVNMPFPDMPPDPGAKLGDLSMKAPPKNDAIPQKYRDAKTSELSYTIKEAQTLEIDLK